MNSINNLLSKTVDEIKKLKSGEKFLVRDLFKGYEWNRIPKKDRILLGTLFLNYAKETATTDIEVIEKSTSNQQKYMKK